MNVAVAPEQRGRGIATMLLERLFELTADDARRGYTLEVRVSNGTAIGLYERLGFQARGIRRGYYTDNREDALIMWKDPVARGGRPVTVSDTGARPGDHVSGRASAGANRLSRPSARPGRRHEALTLSRVCLTPGRVPSRTL